MTCYTGSLHLITFELHNYDWHYVHYIDVTFAGTYTLHTALHGLLHSLLHGSLHDQLHHHDNDLIGITLALRHHDHHYMNYMEVT